MPLSAAKPTETVFESVFASKKSPLAVWFRQGDRPKAYFPYVERRATKHKPIYCRKNGLGVPFRSAKTKSSEPERSLL